MAHVRKQIRDNLFTAIASLSTTGSNRYQSRIFPLDEAKLPAICLYSKSEASAAITINYPRLLECQTTFTLEVYVKAVSNLDNTIDQICLEASEAILADVTRGGLAKDTQLTSLDIEFDADADSGIAVALVEVNVVYNILENDFETAK